MIGCLTVLAKAATALRSGDDENGRQMLSSVMDCGQRGSCASRKLCATAAMGVIRSAAEREAVPATA